MKLSTSYYVLFILFTTTVLSSCSDMGEQHATIHSDATPLPKTNTVSLSDEDNNNILLEDDKPMIVHREDSVFEDDDTSSGTDDSYDSYGVKIITPSDCVISDDDTAQRDENGDVKKERNIYSEEDTYEFAPVNRFTYRTHVLRRRSWHIPASWRSDILDEYSNSDEDTSDSAGSLVTIFRLTNKIAIHMHKNKKYKPSD